MRHRTILGLIAVMAAATMAPTAVMAQQSRDSEGGASQPEAVRVRVSNHNWLDMHVYASVNGQPLRSLGMVTAMGSAELRLPADLTVVGSDLRMVADPIGGNGIYVSRELLVNPGSEVVMVIQNPLALSYTTVAAQADAG